MKKKRIVILGAGAMGSALTIPLVENGHDVTLWGTEKDKDVIDAMRRNDLHPRLGLFLPREVLFISSEMSPGGLIRRGDIVVIAVSSNALESILERVAPNIGSDVIVVNVAKGLSQENRFVVTHSHFIRKRCHPRAIVAVGGAVSCRGTCAAQNYYSGLCLRRPQGR